jgi:hypothetical protein
MSSKLNKCKPLGRNVCETCLKGFVWLPFLRITLGEKGRFNPMFTQFQPNPQHLRLRDVIILVSLEQRFGWDFLCNWARKRKNLELNCSKIFLSHKIPPKVIFRNLSKIPDSRVIPTFSHETSPSSSAECFLPPDDSIHRNLRDNFQSFFTLIFLSGKAEKTTTKMLF